MIAEQLDPIQRRALAHGVPYRVHAIVTHRCNLACHHCYQAEHAGPELSVAEWSQAFAEMARLGAMFLVIGGGEPLSRRDFWQLLESAAGHRFAIELFTNGMLIDAEVARRLKEGGVMQATLSLHGGHALTHDLFVQRPGSFDRIQRAIDHLEAAGLRVAVRSNVTTQNWRELPLLELRYQGRPLVRYDGAGADLHARDDGDRTPHLFRMTEAQERAFVRRRIDGYDAATVARKMDELRRSQDRSERDVMPCQAARTYFAIQPNGDVTPCTQTTAHPMGNLRRTPLERIWRDSQAARRFRAIDLSHFTSETEQCAQCRYRHLCSRCPAMSEEHSGSLTGWNPQTCQSTLVYWTELERRAAELGVPVP